MLAILVVSTGNYILLNYAVLVFTKSGADLSPCTSTVMLFIAQICGCLCTTELADRLGRKILIVVSVIGSAFGFLTLAAYLHLVENGVDTHFFTWIPVTSLSLVVFISAAGIAPLCNLYTIELLPYKVCPGYQNPYNREIFADMSQIYNLISDNKCYSLNGRMIVYPYHFISYQFIL